MFEKSFDRIDTYFCDYTNYKKLENTFDDRYSDYAYLIKEFDGIVSFTETSHNNVLVAKRKFKIYLQFKGELNYKVVEGLLHVLKCSQEELIEANTDSALVFKEVTGHEMKSDTFGFAYLIVQFRDVLTGRVCDIC